MTTLNRIDILTDSELSSKIIYQTGKYDCGQSIIRLLIREYNFKIQEEDPLLSSDLPLSMLNMKLIFERIGFNCKGYAFENAENMMDWLDNCTYKECILLMKNTSCYYKYMKSPSFLDKYMNIFISENPQIGHWVLLHSHTQDKVILLDPFWGVLNLDKAVLNVIWEGKCLILNKKNQS